MAAPTYFVYTCSSNRTVAAEVPNTRERPTCATGAGTWQTVKAYTDDDIKALIEEKAQQEFDWELVRWAAGAGIGMWVTGIAVGLLIAVIRRGRI